MSEDTRREEGEELQGLDASVYKLIPMYLRRRASGEGRLARPEGHEPYDLISKKFMRSDLGTSQGPGQASDPQATQDVDYLVGKQTRMFRRQVNMLPAVISLNNTTVVPVLTQQIDRTYLFLVNLDAAATAFIGIGYQPTTGTGLPLQPNGGFYEPLQVPINELFGLSSAASSRILVLYAIKN